MPGIDVNGSRVAFEAYGGGSTVVALHASASTGKQWKSLAQHLEKRFCIFTPDLPGYGSSSAATGSDGPSIFAEAETVFGLIEAWQEPVHLVGHSYGGAVALGIALHHPEWIKSLTLIEPLAFHVLNTGLSDDAELLARINGVRDAIKSALARNRPQDGMARLVDFWNGTGAWARTSPEMKDRLAGEAAQVIKNFEAADKDPPSLADLRTLGVPALVMMGTESPLVSLRATEIIAGALGNARLQIVAGGGHMLPLTDPHIVDPSIAAHVKAVDERKIRAARPLAA